MKFDSSAQKDVDKIFHSVFSPRSQSLRDMGVSGILENLKPHIFPTPTVSQLKILLAEMPEVCLRERTENGSLIEICLLGNFHIKDDWITADIKSVSKIIDCRKAINDFYFLTIRLVMGQFVGRSKGRDRLVSTAYHQALS